MSPTPSADDQLTFLATLQRLLAEGDFSSTYKFALLIALADLAVEQGGEQPGPMTIPLRVIGERFIELYWPQVQKYSGASADASLGILAQNHGVQARVVASIAAFRDQTGPVSFQKARALPGYSALLSTVTATVAAQPLNYLQNFGGATHRFLFSRTHGAITLQDGVGFCLRRFHPLIHSLARTAWIGHLKNNRLNHAILGEARDLEEFLFGATRASLERMGKGLRALSGARCFYCELALDTFDVDHFIPFSHYPRDLAHNFVLAHPSCNRSKGAALASIEHLERWLTRLTRERDTLAEIGYAAGLMVDGATSARVAHWGYSKAIDTRASAWRAPASFEPIHGGYLGIFAGELSMEDRVL